MSRRGTGDLRWAAMGISAGREGTNAEGRRAKWGCSLPNGIRSSRVFDPATLSPTKQSRPPGPRCTTGTKHQGLSGHGPPLCDHDDRRAQENPGFLTDAPPQGRRGTLYWNCHRFRSGPRKADCPYRALGLKLPTFDFWKLLQADPAQLAKKLSTSRNTLWPDSIARSALVRLSQVHDPTGHQHRGSHRRARTMDDLSRPQQC